MRRKTLNLFSESFLSITSKLARIRFMGVVGECYCLLTKREVEGR